MSEKRFFIRIPAYLECSCAYNGIHLAGVIRDFSSDGMRICIGCNEQPDFRDGSTMTVKYHTGLETENTVAPIIIKCEVIIRNTFLGYDDDYQYYYELGCQLQNALDYREEACS